MQVSIARPGELGPPEIAAWRHMQQQTQFLANPFLCADFAVAVGTFHPGARVAVLTDGSQLVGFFPFERRQFGLGAPIGTGLTNAHGLIHAPGADWDPCQLLRACGLSVWRFDNLVEGQQSFAPYTAAVKPSPVIDLADGFSAYAEKLRRKSPQFCRDVARRARSLERERGALRFESDARDMADLRVLMGWKSAQFRRNGWVDIFDRRWIVDLVDYLFSVHDGMFGGLLSVLYAGDTPVAGHFGLRFGPTLAGWFPAYDTRFGRHSPGHIQNLRMAEESAAQGVRLIDMGAGSGSYKQLLRSRDLLVAEGTVTRGRLAAGAYRACSAGTGWARRRARQHPLLFQAADRVLRHYGRIR